MLPSLEFPADPSWAVPDEMQCALLWDKYEVPPHIRDHCRAVAGVAVEIVSRAEERGVIPAGRALSVPLARAAALLHDIAKNYTIRHGGSHAQLGAAWVREETGNPLLAQAVLFHVEWPWSGGEMDDVRDPMRLPIIVAYADKRVRHTQVVSVKERFDDLLVRYGISADKMETIAVNYAHVQAVEQAIFDRVGSL
ncbi:HD domain-containing protein [Mailhella massiliensis]|uniref:HD domain-containing protein n=1 Tax=Mailhella massiliensis TaxID=1903261 RepID=A0A921AV37_9BACT|nr:HD domain-containing protein [Mailhella massiliensis]HJD96367.1 HD domain-containing protein [Mailhella massiliensis]